MTEVSLVQGDSNGAAPAETVTGTTVAEFIPGQLMNGIPEIKKTEPSKVQAKVETQKEVVSKEERHAAKKISELTKSKMDFARIAVTADESAIYTIADNDPDLAAKLLKEFDYGTEDLDELLAKRNNPEATKEELAEEVKVDKRFKTLEKKLLDETISKLKEKHPDLTDDLEDMYRSVYSDSKYENLSDERKLAVARALTGKTESEGNQQAMLDMLKSQEGALSQVKAKPTSTSKKLIPDDQASVYAAAGVTEELAARFLPDGIDDYISKMAFTRTISE